MGRFDKNFLFKPFDENYLFEEYHLLYYHMNFLLVLMASKETLLLTIRCEVGSNSSQHFGVFVYIFSVPSVTWSTRYLGSVQHHQISLIIGGCSKFIHLIILLYFFSVNKFNKIKFILLNIFLSLLVTYFLTPNLCSCTVCVYTFLVSLLLILCVYY